MPVRVISLHRCAVRVGLVGSRLESLMCSVSVRVATVLCVYRRLVVSPCPRRLALLACSAIFA
jgi:hypothetical protein